MKLLYLYIILLFIFLTFIIYVNSREKVHHSYISKNSFEDKNFHQTWKTNNLTEEQAKNVEKTRKLYPRWNYKLWTDEDLAPFVQTEFPELYEMWDSIQPFIKKLDFIRYLWMYKYGGIYSDFDIKWRKNVEELLLYDNAYIPVGYVNVNKLKWDCGDASPALLISGKGNIIWLMMVRYIAENGEKNVHYATGPTALNNFVICIRDLNLRVSYIDESALGLGGYKFFTDGYCYHENHSVWDHYHPPFEFKNQSAIEYLDKVIVEEIGEDKYSQFLSKMKNNGKLVKILF